jgi:ATP-dependent helicase/nuclease subunit A
MNLHQVKGLEAPVVFLIDPADERPFDIDLFVDRSAAPAPRHPAPRHPERSEGPQDAQDEAIPEARGHFVVTRAWGKGKKVLAAPPGWEGYERTEKEFKRAEKMRLLYVAATPAKRMLIVGYRQTAKGTKGAWSELAGRVREQLQMPDERKAAEPALSEVEGSFAEAQAEIASRFESAKETSYSVLPITKINHVELVKAEEGLGKGMSWGRVLHRLFEAMLRNESIDVPLYAENLLKDEERDVVELTEIMRVVEAVQSSPLWQRVKVADERYVEIPFALEVPAASLGPPTQPGRHAPPRHHRPGFPRRQRMVRCRLQDRLDRQPSRRAHGVLRTADPPVRRLLVASRQCAHSRQSVLRGRVC